MSVLGSLPEPYNGVALYRDLVSEHANVRAGSGAQLCAKYFPFRSGTSRHQRGTVNITG